MFFYIFYIVLRAELLWDYRGIILLLSIGTLRLLLFLVIVLQAGLLGGHRGIVIGHFACYHKHVQVLKEHWWYNVASNYEQNWSVKDILWNSLAFAFMDTLRSLVTIFVPATVSKFLLTKSQTNEVFLSELFLRTYIVIWYVVKYWKIIDDNNY